MKISPFNDIDLDMNSRFAYRNPLVGVQKNLKTALDLMEIRLFCFNSMIEIARFTMIPATLMNPELLPVTALMFFDYLMITLWPGVVIVHDYFDDSIEIEREMEDRETRIKDVFIQIEGNRVFRYKWGGDFANVPDWNLMGYAVEHLIQQKRLNYFKKLYVAKYLESV